MSDAPERLWVGFEEGRDYHPVFLSAEYAKEHGWNVAEGGDAPGYYHPATIEALQAENERLREALERIANYCSSDHCISQEGVNCGAWSRAALAGEGED